MDNLVSFVSVRRTGRLLAILTLVVATVVISLAPAQAAGGAYTIKWYAADPAVGRAPYLPSYLKQAPSSLACPTPSGGAGRAADPMANAVAYGPTFSANNLDAVTSLAPKDLALGQIVPFEVELKVSGSTAPENGVVQFTGGWNTHTTSGDNFGYDPTYMVYCAFVDTADPGTIDTDGAAKVDSWSATLANPGGGATEEIHGTFHVSGLNDGDYVIVEVWVVLKPTIPPGSSGNVQTRLIDAQTANGDAISTGNQTVPLLRVKEFFTSNADVSVTKSDSPDPIVAEQQLTYSIIVTNNSPDTIANGVVVTDNLDPNTSFVSASETFCSASAGVVTCNVGALNPGQSVTITIVSTVSATAPTENDPSMNPATGACAVGPSFDLCNIVSVTAITADPATANNSASEPTNVLPRGSIGDYVWVDVNGDGVQDAGEMGLNGVIVDLLDGSGTPVLDGNNNPITTLTANNPVGGQPGWYEFAGLPAGSYIVQFERPDGYSFTLRFQGGNVTQDSNADTTTGPTYGQSEVVTLAAGQNNPTIDAGLKSGSPTAVSLAGFSARGGRTPWGGVALLGLVLVGLVFSQWRWRR